MTDRTELPDGIYIDLSFAEYLAQRRVSSGDLTKLMEGPSSFWADSWMNPQREEREETDAMKLGRAYHCARLEPDVFEDLFIREMDVDDMPEGSLLKDTDYKIWLKNMGEAQTKAGETVLDRARRVEAIGGPQTWHAARDEWEKACADLTWIGRKQWDEIQRDAARIRMNPELADLISGGMAEVSILWTDPDTGIKCKARPDYLGRDWITHLKTWDLKASGKPANRAIADTFRFNGYYRTGWFYLMGISAMPDLKLRHAEPIMKGEKVEKPAGRPRKTTDLEENVRQIVAAWQTPKIWNNWFLFVRRSGIPDVRGRQVMYFAAAPGIEEQSIGAEATVQTTSISAIGRKAELEVRSCLRLYAECCEIYGTEGEPWFPRDLVGRLEDDDYSPFWLDSVDDPR
jgi:hypothetical protein